MFDTLIVQNSGRRYLPRYIRENCKTTEQALHIRLYTALAERSKQPERIETFAILSGCWLTTLSVPNRARNLGSRVFGPPDS